jgi:hypothetical protein
MNEETMKWLFNNGLAILVLVAIAYAVAKGWKAFFTLVLIPLKDGGLSLFHSQTKNLEAQTNMMQKQGEMMEKQGETMDKTNATMERVCAELSETRKDVALIKSRTEQCNRAFAVAERTT